MKILHKFNPMKMMVKYCCFLHGVIKRRVLKNHVTHFFGHISRVCVCLCGWQLILHFYFRLIHGIITEAESDGLVGNDCLVEHFFPQGSRLHQGPLNGRWTSNNTRVISPELISSGVKLYLQLLAASQQWPPDLSSGITIMTPQSWSDEDVFKCSAQQVRLTIRVQ